MIIITVLYSARSDKPIINISLIINITVLLLLLLLLYIYYWSATLYTCILWGGPSPGRAEWLGLGDVPYVASSHGAAAETANLSVRWCGLPQQACPLEACLALPSIEAPVSRLSRVQCHVLQWPVPPVPHACHAGTGFPALPHEPPSPHATHVRPT